MTYEDNKKYFYSQSKEKAFLQILKAKTIFTTFEKKKHFYIFAYKNILALYTGKKAFLQTLLTKMLFQTKQFKKIYTAFPDKNHLEP